MTDETHPTAEPAAQPDETPAAKRASKRPQYGEMAPEGWVSPVTGREEPSADAQADADAPTAARSTRDTPSATPTAQAQVSPKLDGVPHNLGVNKNAPAKAAQAAAAQDADGSAETAASASTPMSAEKASKTQAKPGTKIPPRRDRIFTIILLAFGALGALNLGDAFMQLPQSAAQLYAIYDIGTFTAPDWLSIVSTIGWISMLSIWAVSLILSIQLIQRRKLSFYVPLSGAVLSFIVLIIIMSIVVVNGMPELMTYVQTNGLNLDRLQELQ